MGRFGHEARSSLLGGQADPSYQPLGGYHQREGHAVDDPLRSKSSGMYRPNSPWTWAFVSIALLQAVAVLTLEAYVFATFQIDTDNGSEDQTTARTIPTFLTLYIFGIFYQLVLVWDALRLKNTIQIIGLCMLNIGLLIYGAVQMEQIKQAILLLNTAGNINLALWGQTKPFLIAIPCILALGTCFLSVAAWKLYDEFAWTIYKHISADPRMKRRYLIFQIYIALLKFDFFFFLGFTVQFVVIVKSHQAEFALTIAAIPVTIGILIMASYWARRENLIGMIFTIILYLGGLAYFIFKLVRMYEPSHLEAYLPARKELTAFAVLTLILILMTIVNACMVTNNFKRGLKPYVLKRKLESQDEKNRYTYSTEMTAGQSGKMAPGPSRMTID